jgi:hypothetical protein
MSKKFYNLLLGCCWMLFFIYPNFFDFGKSVRTPMWIKAVTQRAYSLSTGNNPSD